MASGGGLAGCFSLEREVGAVSAPTGAIVDNWSS